MDIVTLAAARKGGGGGDVTKAYVDEHLALKADKSETQQYPIADSVSGDAVSVTNSADANVQKLTVYGKSHVSKNVWNGEVSGNSTFAAAVELPADMRTFTISISADGVKQINYVVYNSNGTKIVNDSQLLAAGNTYATAAISNLNEQAYLTIYAVGSGTTVIDWVQVEAGSTPTPYEPYGIISIGDDGSLTITTTDGTASSTATLTTGLPLCGIPVTSGGTYTDEQGQKWLADTASVEGVTKRVYKITFDGSVDENWARYTTGSAGEFAMQIQIDNIISGAISASLMLCDSLTVIPTLVTWGNYDNFISKDSENNIVTGIQSITTVEDWRTYLASNPVTIVYPLATPTTTPLTTEERQALLALRTFGSTTNVTITDDPFVDISYIKNTKNGKAAEQLADNLRASIGWISAVPEMHRNILRGKYLGSAVTAAQLAAIENGSFDDLYVGDYWTIPVTIDGTTINVNWRIADIDCYLHTGDTPLEEHHLVIVPDTGLYAARMNATASNSGGYKASEMYTTNLGTAKTAINTAFPDMVLTHRDLIPENPGDNMSWADSTVELLSEIMVYGTQIMSPCNSSGQYNIFWTIAKSQLALFRLAPQFGVADDTYWLRDVVGQPSFALVAAEGNADANGAANENGVRPYFLLGSAE